MQKSKICQKNGENFSKPCLIVGYKKSYWKPFVKWKYAIDLNSTLFDCWFEVFKGTRIQIRVVQKENYSIIREQWWINGFKSWHKG